MYSISIKFIQRSIQRRYQSCRYAILLYLFWIVKYLRESYFCYYDTVNQNHKKVLMREHKRHTARSASSTPSAVLSGGGHPIPGQGAPSLAGVPPVLTWLGGCLIPGWGTPPHLDPARVPPPSLPGQGVPQPRMGYPHLNLAGVPPPGKNTGPVEVLRDGDGVRPRVWTDKHL